MTIVSARWCDSSDPENLARGSSGGEWLLTIVDDNIVRTVVEADAHIVFFLRVLHSSSMLPHKSTS